MRVHVFIRLQLTFAEGVYFHVHAMMIELMFLSKSSSSTAFVVIERTSMAINREETRKRNHV